METYIFFYEGKQDNPEFEIEKEPNKDVCQTAYETYGPQVDDLMHKEKLIFDNQ